MKVFVPITLVIAFAANVCAEVGDLKVRFVYDGDPPEAKPLEITNDKAFCGKFDLKDESLVVHPTNKGIKNIIVYVYTGRGGTKLPKQTPRNETVVLANDKCRFEPNVVICQSGDTLRVTNPDNVGHNANLHFFSNKPQNFLLPPKQEKSVVLNKAEPAPASVVCNIHPWMKANVAVFDHPFAAVSDDDGNLIIKGLPAGEEITFRAWAEKGSFRDGIIVDGKEEKWKLNRFEVTIEPGMNDLGIVEMPPAAFKLN